MNKPVDEIAKIRYFQPSYEEGIIESVSPEGNKLFVIVRRLPTEEVDRDGNTYKAPGLLFGNEGRLNEDDVTLTELKIPADVDLSQAIIDPVEYINRKVLVKMVAGHPSGCLMREYDNLDPTIITKEQIYNARMQDPERRLHSKASTDFLEKQYGFTKTQIADVIMSTYGKVNPKGYRLANAGTSSWIDQAEADQEGIIDMSDTASVSTNVPASKLRTKTCYYHAKVFSGK